MKHRVIELAEETTAALHAVTDGMEALAREIPKLKNANLTLAESAAIQAQFAKLSEAAARAKACTLILHAMGGVGL